MIIGPLQIGTTMTHDPTIQIELTNNHHRTTAIKNQIRITNERERERERERELKKGERASVRVERSSEERDFCEYFIGGERERERES